MSASLQPSAAPHEDTMPEHLQTSAEAREGEHHAILRAIAELREEVRALREAVLNSRHSVVAS